MVDTQHCVLPLPEGLIMSKATMCRRLIELGCDKAFNTLRGYRAEALEGMLRDAEAVLATELAAVSHQSFEPACAPEHWSSPNGCHPDCPACAPVVDLGVSVPVSELVRVTEALEADMRASLVELRADVVLASQDAPSGAAERPCPIRAAIDELQLWFASKPYGWRESATPGQLQQWADREAELDALIRRLDATVPAPVQTAVRPSTRPSTWVELVTAPFVFVFGLLRL